MNDTDKLIEWFNTATLGVQIAYCVFALAIALLVIIATWKIFVKAGEAGWKAIIPFYNLYILFKICWETKYFWIYLILTFTIGILGGVIQAIPQDSIFAVLISLVALVGIGFLIYYSIMLDIKLSFAFGHGAGFAVGLIFLSFIFELILAFGDSKYIGNQTNQNKN